MVLLLTTCVIGEIPQPWGWFITMERAVRLASTFSRLLSGLKIMNYFCVLVWHNYYRNTLFDEKEVECVHLLTLAFLTRGSCSSGDHSCSLWLPLDFWHFSTLPATLGGNCWRHHPLSSQLCLHTRALLWMALEVVAVGPTEWLNPKDFSWDSLCVVSWGELVGATPCFSVFNLSAPQSLRRHQAWPPGLPHYPFLKPALNLLISRRFSDLTG